MSPVAVALNLAVLAGLVLLLLELRRFRFGPGGAGQARRVRELEELLTTIPDPLVVLDRDGQYLEDYPGTHQQRAVETLKCLSAADRAGFDERLRGAIDQRRRRFHRFTLDDHTIVADVLPLRSTRRRPMAAVCLRDVTEQEESASRVDKLAARNRAILRSAMDGFFVVDEDHRFLEVNDAFCRMTGYSSAELLRMKITDLEVKQPAQRLADSTPLRTGLHQFATAHRHRDGHIIRLETSVIVLRDEGRKILVGFARDVTERLQAEEALEHLSYQNKLILDSAAEGIYGVDVAGRFTFVNPAAACMVGWEVADLIGNCAHELLQHGRCTARSYQAAGCAVCAATRSGTVQHGNDQLFCRKDGSTFPVDFVVSPIREHDQLAGAVVVFRDVSERKRAEEERRRLEANFQQAQKLDSLGKLAAGLAHDFNNLLLTVLCNASLARERLPGDSEVSTQLEKIVKSSRRASELTRQMLAYAGEATYDVHPLELSGLVDEIADLMRAALPKTVKLNLELAPDLPLMEADSAQLQQVVMNVLINAAEAIGHQPGTVTAVTSLCTVEAGQLGPDYLGHPLTPGKHVCLEVSDTGCGMSADTLARIFDPFFTTKATGRGLGLSALLGIVRSHRGALQVCSQPGQGTTFRMLFPVTTGAIPAPSSPRVAKQLPAGTTVLVVDDEEDIREIVRAVLESRGAHVLDAQDGPTGIEEFRRHADKVDVILLDMTMPGMGGEAVFREILNINPRARVVLSSGYSEQEALARLGDKRMAGFVHKPYTAQALVDKIGGALE